MRAADAMPPLDPFALPVETRGRFFMLATAALVAAWSLPSYFIEVPIFWRHLEEITLQDKQVIGEKILSGIPFLGEEAEDLIALSERHPQADMRFRAHIVRALCAFALTTSVVVLALFIAWFRKPRRIPLLMQQAPTIYTELRHLERRLGLDFKLSLGLKRGLLDGEATGGRTGPLIVLAGDPRWLERSWNDLHRAVMLHELGHIVNRDFRIRALVRWLWIVVMGCAFMAAIALVYGGHFSELRRLLARFGLLGVTAWLLLAGLVRDRELYADQRVATWGMGPSLLRRLTLTESFEPDRNDGSASSWYSTLRRFLLGTHHPTHAERIQALESPITLFDLSPVLAFHTGLLLAMSISAFGPLALDLLLPIGFVMGLLLFIPSGALAWPLIIISVFSVIFLALIYMLSGALGSQAFRSALADRICGTSPYRRLLALVWPAVCLTTGFYVGLLPWMGSESLQSLHTWFLAASGVMAWIWLVLTYAMGRWVLGLCPKELPRVLVWASRFVSAVLLLMFCWPLILRWSLDTIVQLATGTGLTMELRSAFLTLLFLLVILMVTVTALGYLAFSRILLGAGCFLCKQCGARFPYRLGVEETCPACQADVASWPYRKIFDPWLGLRSSLEPGA